MLAGVAEHRESYLALGYTGPSLSGLVGLTTVVVAGEEYSSLYRTLLPADLRLCTSDLLLRGRSLALTPRMTSNTRKNRRGVFLGASIALVVL